MTDTPESTPDLAAPPPAEPAAVTGHPVVDQALRALDDVAAAPPAEQIPAYEAAHHVLQQTLATIDES